MDWESEGVARRADLVGALGPSAVRWRVTRGQWQSPAPGIVVLHNGSLTTRQQLWVDLLACGEGAVLAGLTALEMAGLHGFGDQWGRRWVLVPEGRRGTARLNHLVVKRSTRLGAGDTLSLGPPRTRPARATVDAAVWARSDQLARAIVHAVVQQRIVTPSLLRAELALRRHNERHRNVLLEALSDIEGGAHTLPEAEFLRLCRRYRLPRPEGQRYRRDKAGRVRWLDFEWKAYALVAEIDGTGHMDVEQWWDDQRRDNGLVVDGSRVLRFSNHAVRHEGPLVATTLYGALRSGGWNDHHDRMGRDVAITTPQPIRS